jgi:hypothetical protein
MGLPDEEEGLPDEEEGRLSLLADPTLDDEPDMMMQALPSQCLPEKIPKETENQQNPPIWTSTKSLPPSFCPCPVFKTQLISGSPAEVLSICWSKTGQKQLVKNPSWRY